MQESILVDKFGRKHDYLRVSLLERCNLRCTYCMPEEGIALRDKNEFLSQEELLQIIQTFVHLGVKKIRFTGGEPLIKKNFTSILSNVAKLPLELSITTNGVLLDKFWDDFEKYGLRNINISLDTFVAQKFKQITRRNDFDRVFENILKTIKKGFQVKINVVLIKGTNDDEIIDFIEFTRTKNVEVRFIEFMPFNGNKWDTSKKVSEQEILKITKRHFGEENLTRLPIKKNATARKFQINDFKGAFGIISTVTNPFCDSCNRLRLTADGKMKNCLFSSNETDLLKALRNGEQISDYILENVVSKKAAKAGIEDFSKGIEQAENNRPMTTIGG